MLLHQISGGDEVTNAVVTEVRKNSSLVDRIHFFYEPGGTSKKRKDADVNSAGEFRSIGEDFNKITGAPEYADFALKIFGKTLKLDRAYEERGGDIPSEFRRQLLAFGRVLGINLQTYFFTGDSSSDAEQFNGLKKTISLMDATQTLTDTGTNGLQIVAGTDNTAKTSHQKTVESLNNLISAVAGGAEWIAMNGKVWSRISTIARDNVSTTVDEFGRPVQYFNGVPIIHAGYKYDGTEILPLSETKGTSTDCTTIYAGRSAEAAFWSFMTTKNGLKVYPIVANGNFYEQTVELQLDSGAPFNKRSLACLPGVRLS
jgi:hypothetical protein